MPAEPTTLPTADILPVVDRLAAERLPEDVRLPTAAFPVKVALAAERLPGDVRLPTAAFPVKVALAADTFEKVTVLGAVKSSVAAPLVPECVSLKLVAGFVPLPGRSCHPQQSATDAEPFQMFPHSDHFGAFTLAELVAATVV